MYFSARFPHSPIHLLYISYSSLFIFGLELFKPVYSEANSTGATQRL